MSVAKLGWIEGDLDHFSNWCEKEVISVTLRINRGGCTAYKKHPPVAQNLNGHAMVNLWCHDWPTHWLSCDR